MISKRHTLQSGYAKFMWVRNLNGLVSIVNHSLGYLLRTPGAHASQRDRSPGNFVAQLTQPARAVSVV
jgi:hypothetical protein